MPDGFDPRAKLGVLLIFLVAVSTTPPAAQFVFAAYGILLLAAVLAVPFRVAQILSRAAVVLPFTLVFALMTWLGGDAMHALALAEKSLLSVIATVLMMMTTPIAQIVRALEWARVPAMLVLVIQFVHRYLSVVGDEVATLQRAARSRSGVRSDTRAQFRAAAGSVGVLFARSAERAEGIHLAMLARGFTGSFPAMIPLRFAPKDLALLLAGMVIPAAVRFVLR